MRVSGVMMNVRVPDSFPRTVRLTVILPTVISTMMPEKNWSAHERQSNSKVIARSGARRRIPTISAYGNGHNAALLGLLNFLHCGRCGAFARMRRGRRLRQPHDEPRALARLTLDVDIATMRFHDPGDEA